MENAMGVVDCDDDHDEDDDGPISDDDGELEPVEDEEDGNYEYILIFIINVKLVASHIYNRGDIDSRRAGFINRE